MADQSDSSADQNPLDPRLMPTLRHWQAHEAGAGPVIVDCGWGRLLLGQTFTNPEQLVKALEDESEQQRDVAIYVRDPHVIVARSPQRLFLDPSHTFRLPLQRATLADQQHIDWFVRTAQPDDEEAINRILQSRNMVPVAPGFLERGASDERLVLLVAQEAESDNVVGVVTGVDHVKACGDAEGGSSLWSLAVDAQCLRHGIGYALATELAKRFRDRGRRYLDLSVMHDNVEAINLYQKMGFERVPVYCVKNRNPINEKLYVGPSLEEKLNVYAQIIVDEARRRGILAEVIDAEYGYFRLSFGGRQIICRESLSELTTAVAMSRCDDKRVTRRVLEAGGVHTPEQMTVGDDEALRSFLERHPRVVVKPARGEQGHGITVDVRGEEAVRAAIEVAKRYCDDVIIEELAAGEDLRIVVIDHEVVAAATRRPAQVVGDGKTALKTLIERQSRRRAAATHGESTIPIDDETARCIDAAGFDYDSVLPEGKTLTVRKTANLHTGGTIHDVTAELHPHLRSIAEKASRLLDMPVVGLDLMVPAVDGADYAVIEANERPGLANHQPQPTVERFVDLLFPQTCRAANSKERKG
ncbi:N-acetylglutaminylglutamine synthetase [Piscinibacter sakaiensis]|uniref:N-acetylglutaminylglutamine synthetase n=1 Tax=Piscinibacter sakaiensis TaxID=1547922 RepID=UPI003AB0B122